MKLEEGFSLKKYLMKIGAVDGFEDKVIATQDDFIKN